MNTLDIKQQGAVATVWLNRPAVRNAFNQEMIGELTACFEALAVDPTVRVVVLAGRGTVFSAGADLHWMREMAGYSDAENFADAMGLANMLRTLNTCPKPVVARIHGDCVAGGVGLAAVCDVVIAAETATFSLSEVKLGLIPATISPYVMRAMGERAARRYFVTAERFDGKQAVAIGLAHRASSVEQIDQEVASIVATLLLNSPHAMRNAKSLVADLAGRPIDGPLIEDTARRIAEIRSSAEGRDGVKAFLEKRKPEWLSTFPSETE